MHGVTGLLLPVVAAAVAATVLLLWAGGRSTPGVTGPPSATGGRPGATPTPGDGDDRRSMVKVVRVTVRHLGHRFGDHRAEHHHDTQLQVLDGLAAALEAGLPVPQAVKLAVAQVGEPTPGRGCVPDWAELARAAEEGQALAPVWQRLARRSGDPTIGSVARAWRVAALTGAPLARAVRVSAHAARERRRLERAVQVATAGARATVTVLTLLPAAGLGLAAVLGVSPTAMYSHPVAMTSAGAGAVLVLAGQVWARRMVTRVLEGTR